MGFNFQHIKVTSEHALWTLTINRPKALNALNGEVLDEIGDFLRQISEMEFEHVRGLIITGEGPKSFVAGADIKELSTLDENGAAKFALKGQRVFHELNLFKVPVIAAVNGFALGGGCELALACDFIYASKNAKFGLPETSLGLIPGFGGTVRMARAVGIRKARELIYTGEVISADEACRLGLVSRVFETSDEMLIEAKKKMEIIFSRGPLAVASAKKTINQVYDLDIEAAQKFEADSFAELFQTDDVREGTTAFIEGRKPSFKGN
ncbi:MAG: enoyl-CoA hydratase/isomerase family protein [Bdellovibrionaceae bacterium]|nr:enoyl-CoA hydratase/isomerase family protein [Pseudobdellovibrionaceae bacterium]